MSKKQSAQTIKLNAVNKTNVSQANKKPHRLILQLIPEAKVVKSGVVRVMELQEQGWTYVKP